MENEWRPFQRVHGCQRVLDVSERSRVSWHLCELWPSAVSSCLSFSPSASRSVVPTVIRLTYLLLRYRKRSLIYSRNHLLEKLSSIEDRGQTDRVNTLPRPYARARLRRCRWPRLRHAARLAELARSWWRNIKNYYYGRQSILIGRRSRYSCSAYFLHWPWPMTLTFNSRRAIVMTNTHA